MGIMEDAAKWMNGMRNKLDVVDVTYVREGKTPITIPATHGQKMFKKDKGRGAIIYQKSHDFIINVSDLILGGVATEPESGDSIIETSDGKNYLYRVSPINGEQPWEPSGAGRIAYRIHTLSKGEEPSE